MGGRKKNGMERAIYGVRGNEKKSLTASMRRPSFGE